MTQFNVPTKSEVSENNQAIFENLEKQIGFVPNLYATIAKSDNALATFLDFAKAQGKSSLSAKEREAVSLIVSQVNSCRYCQSAHTAIGKMNGFTDEQILEIRKGSSEDTKLNALVKLAKEIAITNGNVGSENLDEFFAAGYDEGSLIDAVLAVIEITFTNYVHNITQVPIDFPIVQELSEEVAA